MTRHLSKTHKTSRGLPVGKQAPTAVFVSATIVIFFLSLSAADSVGFVPSYIDGSTPIPSAIIGNNEQVSLASLPQLGESDPAPAASASSILPTRISIPSVGIDLPVQNPATTDVDTLDALLQNGPARYADSAGLGAKGTMIIFAHSSHLPIVHNKMFQAFNQIPNVKSGATIDILGQDGKDYIYSVDNVEKASTNDGTTIDLSPSEGTRLVLVTCDTLTGKSARYVLTAEFVGTN